MKGSVTKVGYANKEKYTLKTTIPSEVRDYLELTGGDQILWELDKVNGKWIAVIKKV
ncbi:MAG: hypothetical protein A4E25_00092 [Methanobacterium sp. PtaB.Bin024]|jgi:bifunctional DNA-binding transcriptional regulator/antitoxin component of YhaV-PrlF toxin-antitoxin module|nr:MAG: hypothetical protein A4E25_00092 [Methanobacterium sp. PtaB.Bin024]